MSSNHTPTSGPVLVTGANGIVGRAVIQALKNKDISCFAIARPAGNLFADMNLDLGAPLLDVAAHVPFVPSAVVHLAAAVPHSVEYPDTEETAAITRRIDTAVASACRRWQVPIVYASTCGLYDPFSTNAKMEHEPLKVRSPYFAAKQEGERQFSDIGLCTVMRLSAVYGPGLRSSVVLARFLEAARSRHSIQVWGSGQREQDFIHADDVACCILFALQRPGRRTINVASGTPVSMLVLARMVASVVGSGTVEHIAKPDPNDAQRARYSIEKAHRELDWQPAIDLPRGISLLAAEAFRS